MKTAQIRQKFLEYFATLGHQVVSSSSLVPNNDPTLLFTNAGMNQFKDVFLGFDKRAYTRATSSQKCVRAGGKHNDLENVGYTARHHTFFEMLGNFSFGDYFKRDAITFAWNFLTEEKWLGLPKEKLCVTVYASDDEAYDIWQKEIGLSADKIIRIGDNKGAPYASDNFWQMGDTGPCGPCTEIFYDHGEEIAGGPPGSADEDGDRFIEIWNNVFMQYNRDENGILHDLPKPSVDTGMGLERLAAVLQHVHSNYEIDLFQNLIRAAACATGVEFSLENASLKVIADHIRACSFLIADGVMPANDGRGYVLRRIIRRAIRHGYKLGQKGLFFHSLVGALVDEMGDAFPQLTEQQSAIEQTLKQEEVKFAETLENGMSLLNEFLDKPTQMELNASVNETNIKQKRTELLFHGATAFKLYDTFGFPLDLTEDICREHNLKVDIEGFEREMAAQRQRGREGSHFKVSGSVDYSGVDTDFCGYDKHDIEAKIVALYHENQPVESLSEGQTGIVVLDKTSLYAESGGQVGDHGLITNKQTDAKFSISDTQKIKAAVFGHYGKVLQNTLNIGDTVNVSFDMQLRQASMRNHSATHLLHAALRKIVGKHVAQKGSLVNEERTRFDFSHNEPLSAEVINQIEYSVNQVILENHQVDANIMPYDDAVRTGAMALFGEKYGDEVRVIKMGAFSTELCGGTHVKRTGDIGFFKIISESGVAAGIRRIEAVTGEGAINYIQTQDSILKSVFSCVKAQSNDDVLCKINTLQDQVKNLEKSVSQLQDKLANSAGDELLSQVVEINGIKVLAAKIEGANNATLRSTLDHIKDKLGSAIIVLSSAEANKVSLIAGVTDDLKNCYKACDLVNHVAKQVGGKGGGRADMAQAGGTQPEHLLQALSSVADWVKENASVLV